MPGFAALQAVSPPMPQPATRRSAARPALPATPPPAHHQAGAPPAAAALADDDTGLLLGAVRARLQQLVLPTLAPIDWRASVVDCAAALGCLQRGMQARQAMLQLRLLQAEQRLAQQQALLVQTRQALAVVEAESRRAHHQAHTDSLTTLPNRNCFQVRLNQALGLLGPQCPTLALLYLDLDDFKPINDEHGHAVGDEVLRLVATRLQHALRGGDVVARLGGDEFACLLPLGAASGRPQLAQLARKLMRLLALPMQLPVLLPGVVLTVRASIGIAIGPTDGDSADALLRHADAAMYRAKRGHAGPVFHGLAAGA